MKSSNTQTDFLVPAGYEERSGTILGYWKQGTPLHFIPRYVILADNGAQPNKSSALIAGELLSPSTVEMKDEPGTFVKEGELIGVWYRPGLRGLLSLGGAKTYVIPSGEVNVGKPSPMKTFKIFSSGKGELLRVTVDHRNMSCGDPTMSNLFYGLGVAQKPEEFVDPDEIF